MSHRRKTNGILYGSFSFLQLVFSYVVIRADMTETVLDDSFLVDSVFTTESDSWKLSKEIQMGNIDAHLKKTWNTFRDNKISCALCEFMRPAEPISSSPVQVLSPRHQLLRHPHRVSKYIISDLLFAPPVQLAMQSQWIRPRSDLLTLWLRHFCIYAPQSEADFLRLHVCGSLQRQ